MPRSNVEVVEHGVAAINEAYRTGDLGPLRRYAEEECDPEMVLEAPTGAFTEGEWRGPEGAVGFVANQMEVLDGMWLRVDEHIDVELHPVHAFYRCDGRTVRWQIFEDRASALHQLHS